MESLFQNLGTAIAGFIAILFFSYLLIFRKKPSRVSKPPEAAGGWPIIGHLHLLGGSHQLPHITLANLADKYGPAFTIRVGIHPTLVISSRELAKECFTTNDLAVSTRPKLIGAEVLGWNYLSLGFAPYGPYWRELRKITASELLSNIRLEQLRHVRESEVESFLKEIYKKWTKRSTESGSDDVDHVSIEMKTWIGDINLNVSLRLVAGKRYFGVESSDDEKEARRCKEAMREFFHLTGLFLVGDAIPFLRWLDFGGHEKAMREIQKELECLAEEWLVEHRRRRDSGEFHGENDFMDVMMSILESSDLAGYDADTVNKATAMNLIAGGTDTTTVTLVWALSLVLNHKSVLKKIQEELDHIVGKERLVNESDITNLVYLQAVAKETLRLYPAGPLSGPREFTKDCTIGGYHVPKGTRLITNLWKIQTDPRIWADPMEFKPERFLTTHKDVDVKGKHFELIPFGGGRRSCPGITYGLQMTQLVLAALLQAFEVSTDGPVDMTAIFGLTNEKATPLEVLVKPRLYDIPSLYG
ncbi:Cytochrome P450, E-class, group I [Trema orientale]|uniref:Cytochrome P450, E-class, group I n=1 Tax=Trema orientale TaxID=63057 RepID=A0A2P5FMW9_TREOI|nr:Cytochrome P450, E-class, group I [Trema orientale]